MPDDDRSRDALRVPVQHGPTRSNLQSRESREFALNMRSVHNTMRQVQFERECAILRYRERGGNPAFGSFPAAQLVTDPDFARVPCEVSTFSNGEATVRGQKIRTQLRTFKFYNVPEYRTIEGVVVSQVLLDDLIEFEDLTYDVADSSYDRRTGENIVIGALRVSQRAGLR